MTNVHIRDTQGEEEKDMMMEAESRVMQPRAKKYLESSEARRVKEGLFPSLWISFPQSSLLQISGPLNYQSLISVVSNQ